MCRHRHHDSRATICFNKRRRIYGHRSIVKGISGIRTDHFATFDCLYDLHLVVQKFYLSCRFLAYDPALAIDLSLHVVNIRVDPYVSHSKECLWPERCCWQDNKIPIITTRLELDYRVFVEIRLYIPYRIVLANRVLITRAPSNRMGTLHYQSFFTKSPKLPRDEL